MALAGQAVPPARRAFAMGVFFTLYYAVTTATPPAAGWIVDHSGAPDGAIVFGAALLALVVPAAFLFRKLENGARSGPSGKVLASEMNAGNESGRSTDGVLTAPD